MKERELDMQKRKTLEEEQGYLDTKNKDKEECKDKKNNTKKKTRKGK